MKKTLFILVLAFAFVNCDDSSEERDITEVAKLLKSKFNVTLIDDFILLVNKTKQQCPDIDDKIENTIEEVGNCIEQIQSESETACQLIRNNFVRCAEPVRKAVADCLPQESKTLPQLGIKIVSAVISQVCNSTVEQLLEQFNPCLAKEEFASKEPCSKIKDVLVESKNKLPSKTLVCKTLPKVKLCVKAHLEASCKNPVTKQSVLQFYDAIEDATDSECQGINTT